MCLLDNHSCSVVDVYVMGKNLKFLLVKSDIHVLKTHTILFTTDTREKSDEDIHLLKVELWGCVMFIFNHP